MRLAPLLIVLSFGLMRAQTKPTSTQPPDLIFINGNIYVGTVESPNAQGKVPPRPTALAVRGGKITVVGSDAEIRRLRVRHTETVDLGGRFVMPGFNDAHVHLANGGFEKIYVNLVGARALDDFQARIAARVRESPPGEWILGRGWDHTLWPEQRLPTRQDLDEITGDHPAIFTRVDGHIAVANSAALRAAGITAKTRDPEGGKIDRAPNGEATGILRESARALVTSKQSKPSPAQRRRALELALQEAVQAGLTSVQDNSEWEDFLVMEDLEREGKLPLRVCEWLPFPESLDVLQRHRAQHSGNDAMLHTGMLKGFMDGSLGSRTAALLAPYEDDPKNTGVPQFKQTELNEMAKKRVASGFQMGFHAIGDRGVEMALEAFAEAERYAREHGIKSHVGGNGDFRFRIEHAQVVAPGQLERFRDLSVIASMQPNHLLTDMNWALARLGPERAKNSYPWAEFLKFGVPLAFGTDYPVEPITPFRGLYAAVTRKNEQGTKEYFPEQKLNIQQAIAAYTTGSAYAEFADREKGLLTPGMLADFVVLDRDITKIPPSDILNTSVLRTVVGGKTVFEAR